MRLLTPKRTIAPVLLILALMVSASSCDSNKIREARRSAFRIQVVTDAGVDTAVKLLDRGVISNPQAGTIGRAFLRVNHANNTFIEKAAAMKEDSAANRAALFATVREISSAVQELKASGVLGIRNPDNSLAFDTTISAIDVALATIEAALR